MFQQADLTETLQGLPWFIELKQEQIERLVQIARLRQLNPGEALYTEGSQQDFLYIILEGEIELNIFCPNNGNTPIYTAEPLDIVGWDPLTPVIRQRFGTAVALQSCLLVAFSGEALRCLCEEDHELGFFIYRRLTNVVASRLLNVRLGLSDVVLKSSETA